MLISEVINKTYHFFLRVSWNYYFSAFIALLGFTIAYNGLALQSNEGYRRSAINPFSEVIIYGFPSYTHDSPLLPLIAHYTHMTSKQSFYLLTLSITLGGLILFAVTVRKKLKAEFPLLILLLFFSHPVVLDLLCVPGSIDCIIFVLGIVLLFFRLYLAVALCSFLGAFNHPVCCFAFPIIILLRKIAREDGITFQHMFTTIAAILFGRSILYLFLKFFGLETASRLNIITNWPLKQWIAMNLSHFPLTIFSLQDIIWFALGACAFTVFTANRLYFIVFSLTQIMFYVLTFFTVDTTRVFSLLTWAPSIHYIMYSLQLSRQSRSTVMNAELCKTLLIIGLFGLINPSYFMWCGTIEGFNVTNFYFKILQFLKGII